MANSNPFVGTWKPFSWEVTQPDGSTHYLYGKDVVGYLIYTGDGYMSAEIMDPDRQPLEDDFATLTVRELPEFASLSPLLDSTEADLPPQ